MTTNFLISYRELRVYQDAIEHAMQVFETSRDFPAEESKLLTQPLVQSARLVCLHVAQAWQKRRYPSAFAAYLNRAEAEAAATQVWIELAVLCTYLDAETGQELHHNYRKILHELARLISHTDAWTTSVNPNS